MVLTSGIFSLSAQRGRCRTSWLTRLQDTRVQTPLSPLYGIKCNVLRESLSVDSQNNPCATLKRRGSWVISKTNRTKPNHTQVMGSVPTISVEKTDGCQMYLSQESLNTQLITAQSSEMNVLLPSGKTHLLHFLDPCSF